jgi:hypothetical protein
MLRIFFSWQTDLEKHRSIIQGALDAAAKRVGEVKIDHATRDEIGAVEIDNKIFEKIKRADLFVADLSIIGKLGVKKRKSPNPNVLYETGFALSELGEECLFLVSQNENDGSDKFPFDLRNRRIAFFDFSDQNTKTFLSRDFEGFFRMHNARGKVDESNSPKTSILLRSNTADWNNWSAMVPSFRVRITVDNYLNDKPNFIEQAFLTATDGESDTWQTNHYKIGAGSINQRFKIDAYDKQDVEVFMNIGGNVVFGQTRPDKPDLDRDSIKANFVLADGSMIVHKVKINY